MEVNYYSVYDKVAKEYGPLFFAKNDGVAIRMFNQMVNSDKFDVNDYQLRGLFVFDTETGSIVEEGSYIVGSNDEVKDNV